MRRRVWTCVGLVFTAVAVILAKGEQPQPAAATEAQNVRLEDAGGGAVRIRYDLLGPSNTTFDVSLRISIDAGMTFDVQPKALSGDVGSKVPAGAGKTIVWEAAKDVERLSLDRMRARVLAVRAEPVVNTPAKTSPPEIPAAGQPRKSNARMFAIIGGAVAAGAAAALSGGDDGPGGSGPQQTTTPGTTNRPPVVTSGTGDHCGDAYWSEDSDVVGDTVGIATATTFWFGANAADPDGDPLTFTFDFGNGVSTPVQGTPAGVSSTTGTVLRASARHVYANAGRYNARTTISDGRGGQVTCGFNANVIELVSGTWTGGASSGSSSSTLVLSQNGSRISGTFVEDGRLTFGIDAGRSSVSQTGSFAIVRVVVGRNGVDLIFTLDPSKNLRSLAGSYTFAGRSGSITYRK